MLGQLLVASRKLPRAQQLSFVEDFAGWLDDGYSPMAACRALALNAQQQHLRAEYRLAQELMQTLQRGQPLQRALSLFIDQDLRLLFAVGEQAGCLQALLVAFQRMHHQRRAAIQGFLKPLWYPLIMMLITLAGSFVVGQTVLPDLLMQIGSVEMNSLTRLLQWLSQPGLLGLVVGLIVVALLLMWGPSWLPGQDSPVGRWLFRYGAFRVARGFAAIELLQLLNLLLQQGFNLEQAARALRSSASRRLNQHLWLIRQRLAAGERRLAVVLDTGLLTPRMLFRLSNNTSTLGQRNEGELLGIAAQRAGNDALVTLARARLMTLMVSYLITVGFILVMIGGLGSLMMQMLTPVT